MKRLKDVYRCVLCGGDMQIIKFDKKKEKFTTAVKDADTRKLLLLKKRELTMKNMLSSFLRKTVLLLGSVPKAE